MNKSSISGGEDPAKCILEEASGLSRRDVFLLEMYKQCSGHLNRHVSAMWQCVAAAFALGAALRMDEHGAPFDYAVTLAILICTWLIASNLDASAWFNRNITIITNIERQFLEKDDAKLIHALFIRTPSPGKIIMHFKIQIAFAAGVALAVLTIHFFRRMASNVCLSFSSLDSSSFLPYLVFVFAVSVLVRLYIRQMKEQRDLNVACPGRQYI